MFCDIILIPTGCLQCGKTIFTSKNYFSSSFPVFFHGKTFFYQPAPANPAVMFCVMFADTAPSILSNIMRLKSDLANITEPDFGLLDQLLSREVLDRRQYAKVRSGDKTVYERNDAMLDLLVSDDQCDKFVTALQLTGQQHIVNFVTQNGGQKHCNYLSCDEFLSACLLT